MRKVWGFRSTQIIVLVPLSLAGLISLATGIRHAIEYHSHDLQWMGALLVRQHIDPWQECLHTIRTTMSILLRRTIFTFSIWFFFR